MKNIFIPAVIALGAAMTFMSCDSKKTDTTTAADDNESPAVETVNDDVAPAPEAEAPAPADWMPRDAKVMPSGLGIVIENPGSDVKAGPASMVTLNYRGRLVDGTVFDSSYDRGQPATFSPSQVIPGFGEGIQLIGVGGKATLYIPGNIAYGPQAIPQAGIGPNENLIFDIEVLDVK